MPTTRDDVVRAAVELLDEQGLAGLTLRALAARLGVSAPTLYWHVRDKRELLDLVCEQVLQDWLPEGRRLPRPGEPVEGWLADIARQQRAALLAHRDSAQVVAGNRPTEAALPGIDQTLGVLVDAGLEPGEAVRVLTAIGSFVVGDALETQAVRERGGEPAPSTIPADWPGRYPFLTAAAASVGGDDERFEEGLALLTAGLRARLAERAAARTPSLP